MRQVASWSLCTPALVKITSVCGTGMRKRRESWRRWTKVYKIENSQQEISLPENDTNNAPNMQISTYTWTAPKANWWQSDDRSYIKTYLTKPSGCRKILFKTFEGGTIVLQDGAVIATATAAQCSWHARVRRNVMVQLRAMWTWEIHGRHGNVAPLGNGGDSWPSVEIEAITEHSMP